MKYGESIFDIVYLLFAAVSGVYILAKRKDAVGKLAGVAVLLLGAGDAFHLVPRVLNYFVDGDFTAALGIGKLVTSITMTVFYVLMYHIRQKLYGEKGNTALTVSVYALAAVRAVLCLLPQNGWLTNDGSVLWGVVRNVPFVALGCVIVCLYFKKRKEIRRFRAVWLLVTLSFAFYIPVAVGASLVPLLGMLMLPKTVCYIILIWIFAKDASDNSRADGV